jgi:hypothetical protein
MKKLISLVLFYSISLLNAWEWTGAVSFSYQGILSGEETAQEAGLMEHDFELEHAHIQITHILNDNLSIVIGPCISHHSLYSLRYAYIEYELLKTDYETLLGVELGRYIVPFGIFNRLAEVTVYPTVSRPMLYASHDQDFIGLHDFPKPVFMTQYSEIGLNIFGYKWFGKHSISYSLFTGNGMYQRGFTGHVHGEEHTLLEESPEFVDIEWLQEKRFTSDNNSNKMVGGRVSYGFGDVLSFGLSGMTGKYDPHNELSYSPIGADLQLKILNLNLRAEFVRNIVEFKGVSVIDSLSEVGEYETQGYYLLSLLPIGNFEFVFMYDFLKRKGPEVIDGFFEPQGEEIETSVSKFSLGLNWQVNDYLKIKSEYAFWNFKGSEEELEDVSRLSIASVISF